MSVPASVVPEPTPVARAAQVASPPMTIAASTWEFQVGGYQVCRKWLRERSGRILSPVEIGRFQQITEAIAESVGVVREIDEAISAAGGWPHAFFGKSADSI